MDEKYRPNQAALVEHVIGMPVFIVGTPRSGTTLLRLLLNNHPQIAIPDETGIMNWLYKNPGQPRILLPNASRTHNLATAFGVDLAAEFDALRRYQRPRGRRAKIVWFFERYAHQKGKRYWGDKTPGHARYIRELKSLFPEGTIVFMLRDPRAVVASFLRYKESELRTKGDFWICDTLDEAVHRYRRFIRPAIDFAQHVEFVRYEELVAEPVDSLHGLCHILGLEFNARMLEYDGEREFFEGASKREGVLPEWKGQALRGIDPTLVDNWRHEFTSDDIEYLDRALSPFLDRFGYTRMST
jgi:hypothetical protein